MKDKETITYIERLESAGIETIYPPDFEFSRHEKRWHEVKLKYNGKEIMRPSAASVVNTVKREFGLDI